MIVEGAKMAVVDMLSFTPPPSAVSSTSLMSVSSFGIHAMTMGSPSINFKKHDSRHAVTKSHGATTEYLHVTGTGSGIHVLHKDLPNRLLTDGIRYQPRYDDAIAAADLSKAKIETWGDPEVIHGETIYVNAEHGSDVVVVDVPVPGWLPKSFTYKITGNSTVPVAVSLISLQVHNGTLQYLNNTTGKYQIGRYAEEMSFNSRGYLEFTSKPDYSINDSFYDTVNYFLRLELPKNDWETKGKALIESVETFYADNYILANPNFDKTINWLVNADFTNYTELSGVPKDILNEYGIVDFQSWEVLSNYVAGYNIGDVGYVGKELLWDGVHFQASSTTGIGAARISQRFKQHHSTYDTFLSEPAGSPYKGFATLAFDLYSETAGANGLSIQLKDTTTGEWYTFALDGGIGSWGYNEPMVVGNVSIGEWRTYSTVIPTDGREQSVFEISIIGDGTDSGMAEYTVRNLRFGQVEGWRFGNEGLSLADHEEGPGIIMSSTQTTVEGEDYSGLTFVGQKFTGLYPEKAYNLVVDAESLSGEYGKIGVAIAHRDFSNVSDRNRFDVAKSAGMLDLTKTTGAKTLNSGYAYYLSPFTSPSAVTDPSGTEVDDENYKNSNRAVLFDASFQDDDQRIFVPIDPAITIQIDSETSSTVEQYYVGLRIRKEGSALKDLHYNFATSEWDTFNRASTAMVNNINYNISLEDLSSELDVYVKSELNSYASQGKYPMCLEFRSSVNGADITTSLASGFHIKDIRIESYVSNLSGTEFFNGGNSVRALYYDGSGSWTPDTSLSRPRYSDTSVPAGSVIELDIDASSTNTITIWGQELLGDLNDNYIGTVDLGANLESTFDVFIFPLSGQGVHVKSVGLSDYCLNQYHGVEDIRNLDLKTSEYKWGTIPFIEGGWHVQPQSENDGTYPRIEQDLIYGHDAIRFVKDSANPRNAIIAHTVMASSVGFLSDQFKVSIDHVESPGTTMTLKYGILYKKEDGTELVWDFTDLRWKRYHNGVVASTHIDGLEDITVFPYAGANADKYENYISAPISTVKESRPGDMITTFFRLSWLGAGAQSALTDFRYYSLVDPVDASSVFPDFPNPNDTTVQPVTDGPGELGHFLNKMEFAGRGVEGIANYEEGVDDGCYPETSGTTIFSAGSFSQSYGNLNEYGVITPNGFILEQKVEERASQVLLDSSAGMVVSAVSPVSSTKQVAYSITLTRDEWEMLNTYYGGLGALGLWTIDYTKTSIKFGSHEGLGGPPFLASGSPTALATVGGGGASSTRNDAGAGPEYLNGAVLVAQATANDELSLFHTGAGSPRGRVNPNGWCVSGDTYTLVLEYKSIGDNIKLKSDNFSDVNLTSDGVWHRETVSFTASADGHNKIGILLRKSSDPIDIQNPKVLVGSAVLTNDTSSVTVKSFDFSDQQQLNAFSTKYLSPNSIEPLYIGWDGDFYATSLYNSSVLVEKEPEFRLFSKKVFFPGGLQIDPSSDFITVTWVIDF